jgi:hypothetical protein
MQDFRYNSSRAANWNARGPHRGAVGICARFLAAMQSMNRRRTGASLRIDQTSWIGHCCRPQLKHWAESMESMAERTRAKPGPNQSGAPGCRMSSTLRWVAFSTLPGHYLCVRRGLVLTEFSNKKLARQQHTFVFPKDCTASAEPWLSVPRQQSLSMNWLPSHYLRRTVPGAVLETPPNFSLIPSAHAANALLLFQL